MSIVTVTLALIGVLFDPRRAVATGDVNEPSCPAATEASPGFHTWMPDCRAVEVVSQANTGDTGEVVGSYGFPEGDHVFYQDFLPTPGQGASSGLSERFLATRSALGWQDHAISPPQGEGPENVSLEVQRNAEGVIFTNDFHDAVLMSPFRNPLEAPQLNQSLGMNVYSLPLDGGAPSLLSLPDSGPLTQAIIETPSAYAGVASAKDWGQFLAGASTDGERVFFVTTAKLATAPGTPADTHQASNEIYERTGGHTYLVGLLPGNAVPKCGAEVSQGIASTPEGEYYSYGDIAPSGGNVVFKVPGPQAFGECNEEHGLFLRNVVDGTTTRLSGTFFGGRAGIDPGEEEKIITVGGEKVFEYQVGTQQSVEIGEGSLVAYSSDGSRVYLLGSEEAIYLYESGKPLVRVPGTQAGSYLSGGGRRGGYILGTGTSFYGETANMPVATVDGMHLLFIDSAQLTSYKNNEHQEAYVYDAAANKVRCISCNPTGAEPPENLKEGDAQLIDNFSLDTADLQFQTPSPPLITNDGTRAVFETTEALVPQDVNGTMDVYEWIQEGTNGCDGQESPGFSAVNEGCVYMLSSGLGEEVTNFDGVKDGTHLVGASEELRDIYMQTSEALLPGLDNASHLYDARVEGGFPYAPPPPRGCEASMCESLGTEAVATSEPASQDMGGPGNVKSVVVAVGKPRSRSKYLMRALRACRKRHGSGRRRCERQARARYAKHERSTSHGRTR